MYSLRLFIFSFFILFISSQTYAQKSSELYKEAKALKNDGKKYKAISLFEKTLKKAESEHNIPIQMNSHIELAELKDNVINYKEALEHYKSFSSLYKKQMSQKTKVLEESVTDLTTEVKENIIEIDSKNQAIDSKNQAIDSLTTEQLMADIAIKDLELDNKNQQLEILESESRRNILMLLLGMFVILLTFIIFGYIKNRSVNKILRNKNHQIIKEREKSENLLLNILPKTIADELKKSGKTTSAKHEIATVMFTDFKGFTKFSEKNTPEDLVAMIDYYFSAFDEIIGKYNIEKIKTIGDAYLCVSGIPVHNPDHVSNMVNAAIEIQNFVTKTTKTQSRSGGAYLQMRVGIHCGPLVAGVVGSKKFAYDVWGDTVNIAARMEQSGEPTSINVSESVYQQVKNDFTFEYRGEIEAKNKGKMKMYFVSQSLIT